ncbi:MAG: hypothetical protein KatS3mg102_2764 [Planctomycetota bacterium]|nr:MAG: hypothetical protein KatS3mg102_2764 [Planctomycetota bacterium]
MSQRTTLGLLLLALALAAYYLWVERAQPSPEQVRARSTRLFADWDAAGVVRIALERAAAQPATPAGATATAASPARVVLVRERAGAPWWIIEPVRAAADPRVVEGLLGALQYAERVDELQRFDPAALGLEPPRLRVEVGHADGTRNVLRIGRLEPSGRLVHVRRDEEPVVVRTSARLFERFEVGLPQLRDRRLFDIPHWRIERVIVQRPGEALRLVREGSEWRLEEPLQDWADEERVEQLLQAALQLEAQRFVEAAAADLERYGLHSPPYALTLEGAGQQQTVLFGTPGEGASATRHARRADRSEVVVVADTVFAHLGEPAEQWRSRRLLHLGREPVRAIEVRAPDGGVRARLERQQGGGWAFAVPLAEGADAAAVERLLGELQALRIETVVSRAPEALANFGLERPLVVQIEQRGARHLLRLGKQAPRYDAYYLQRGEEPSVLQALIPEAERLLWLYPLLRERRLTAFPPAEVRRLVVERPGQEPRPFVRLAEGGWSTPGPRRPDAAALERLAAVLGQLRAVRFVSPPAAAAPEQLGLAAPWLVVRAWRAVADQPFEEIELALGTTDEAGAFRARLRRRPLPASGEPALPPWQQLPLFTLEREVVDALDATLWLPDPQALRHGVELQGAVPAASSASATPLAATPTAAPAAASPPTAGARPALPAAPAPPGEGPR